MYVGEMTPMVSLKLELEGRPAIAAEALKSYDYTFKHLRPTIAYTSRAPQLFKLAVREDSAVLSSIQQLADPQARISPPFGAIPIAANAT